MAKTIVGLEVTEESVRAAEVTLARRPQLVSYGEVPLAPESARDSEVLDEGAVALALRQLWTGARFKSRDVAIGVASRRILVREYTTQAMRPDLLRDALPYQVQDLLPVPASQAVLDFLPLSEGDGNVSGLLVAAISENIEQIISTLARVKLRTHSVDLTAFGLARATAPLGETTETIATVAIGDHTTQVVVARNGVPQFVRILPVDVATTAAMRHQAIEDSESISDMVPMTTRTRGAMRSSLPPGAADLTARIRSTLSFFTGRPNATRIDRLFVTGGGVAAEGIMPALAAAVDIPPQIVSTADVIATSGPAPAGELALNLVSTVGITIGEVL